MCARTVELRSENYECARSMPEKLFFSLIVRDKYLYTRRARALFIYLEHVRATLYIIRFRASTAPRRYNAGPYTFFSLARSQESGRLMPTGWERERERRRRYTIYYFSSRPHCLCGRERERCPESRKDVYFAPRGEGTGAARRRDDYCAVCFETSVPVV